jgi:predicted dehydrogenase
MVEPVRIGIIGCGDVMTAYMYHAQLLQGQGLVEVTWACDTREERKDFMRQRYGVRRFTTDFHKLLDSPEVDLVLILTSMPYHGSLALAALQAGKHVLLEKPMAVKLDEAARLVETSKTSPGLLVCAPFVMLSPTYQAIWQRIQRGDIGRVLSARARYGHAGPTWGSWYYQAGGAVFDLAPYNITSLTGLIGPAKRVTAFTGTAIPERLVDGEKIKVQIEDNAHVLIDFGEGTFAVITAGFTLQQYRCPAIELYGLQGTMQMMGDDWDPEGYEIFLNDVGAWQIFKETDPGWLWTDGLRHAVECIRSNTQPLITPEHAYHTLEIMIKAKEAGNSGMVKIIDSTFPKPVFGTTQAEQKAIHLVHDRTHLREE